MKPSQRHAVGGGDRIAGRTAVAGLFFFSGVIALIYEVVWQRQFALLLGSAAPATAAVLAAYFAGMGAGSLVLGRIADRWPNPIRLYAILEVLIAVGAAGTTGLIPAFERFYPWLYERLADIPGAFFGAKLLMAFMAILIPTFCMGGTLPVLGRFTDREHHQLGVRAGLLYVVNTAGAALGALSVPFIFLPWLGITGTLGSCMLGNIAIAGCAWWLAKRSNSTVAASTGEATKPTRTRAIEETPLLLFVLALISGGVAFALQVYWNRALAQVHENSVHSFAAIVTVVILALTIGAQIARLALKRRFAPRRILSASWCVAGITVALGPWLFVWLTDGLSYISTGGSWFEHAGKLVGTTSAVLLVPFILMGVALPVIMEDAGTSSRLGTSDLLGRILLVNIVGSVAGALFAGFAAPHFMTLWRGIVVLGALLTLTGGIVLFEAQHRWQPVRWIPASLVVAATCFLPTQKINLPRVKVDDGVGEQVLSIAEGTHGITAVTERSGSRRLKLNNHYLLGGTASTGDERLQAHLPLLLHPDPRKVAFLGLGTGITTGGATFHPVKQITAIELVPEVVDAARTQFAHANAHVLDDRRTRVVIEDARNYLRGSREKFDVIVGDLVVPWRQGEGALFTAESFAAARDSLAPGGLFCQWIPCFQLSETEVRTLIRTFLSVFPEAMLWRGDFSPTEPAIALMSWNGDGTVRPDDLKIRVSQMKADPANHHLVSPTIVWMYYLGSIRQDNQVIQEAALNTDNRPVIELLGPLQGRDGNSHLLTGRRLQSFLKTLFGPDQPQLARSDSDKVTGRRAGAEFEEMMLQLSEGNAAGARAHQATIRSLLPDDEYKLLFP